MQQEIEAKFLHQNHDEIRQKLKALGAKCTEPMRTMRRKIIDYPDRRLQKRDDVWAFIRVRDEGEGVTLTLKQFAKHDLADAREIEIGVDSFKNAVAFLEGIGLEVQSYQVTKRETWLLGDCEVMLDVWPWLSPYIEVEGPSQDSIRSVSQALGLAWADAVFGDVNEAYKSEYPGIGSDETIGMIEVIDFDSPVPEWLKSRQ